MSFFRFWYSDPDVFADVLVCPLSTYRRLPLKSLRIYVPRSGRIYLDNMRDTKTFFHEASHQCYYFAYAIAIQNRPGPRSG
jgi:hypothetical protein